MPLTFFIFLSHSLFPSASSLSWLIWALLLWLQIDSPADTTLSLHHYHLCNVMAVLWWLFSLGLSFAFWWHNTPCQPHQNIIIVPTTVFHTSQGWAINPLYSNIILHFATLSPFRTPSVFFPSKIQKVPNIFSLLPFSLFLSFFLPFDT